jgi:prevent-host-death family protein
MSEIRVGVRDLKARLSEYLRLVKAGQSITITDHGHPVGQLVPAAQTGGQALEERLKALQEAGMVAWNGHKISPQAPLAVNQSDQQVSDIVIAMRE